MGNLHPKINDELLREIFGAIAPLESCKIIKDKAVCISLFLLSVMVSGSRADGRKGEKGDGEEEGRGV